MKRVNFRTATLLFFLILLTFNIVRFLLCPCEGRITGFFFHHPAWFYFPLVFIYLIVPVILSFMPCTQFHHPVICHGNREEKTVAITFDDGPDPATTPAILEALRKHDVKATFFVIGHKIAGNEELIKKIDAEGHILGNHSFAHTNLWDFWPSFLIHRDLLKTEALIQSITGRKVKFFRPPYGVINPMVSGGLRKTHYTVIAWSRWSLDTAIIDPERLYQRITDKLKPGDIILMHDTQQVTAEILDRALISIREQGLKVVPLENLVNLPAYE